MRRRIENRRGEVSYQSLYGRPEDAVGSDQRRRQWRAGLSLMHRISLPVKSVGFGIVAMTYWRLWFLEDAWDFDDL